MNANMRNVYESEARQKVCYICILFGIRQGSK